MVQMIVTHAMEDTIRQRVLDLGLPVHSITVGKDGEASDDLATAEVFFRAFVSSEAYDRVLRDARQLRWIHTGSAGVDELGIDELQARGITLTNSAGIHAIPIAEWVLYGLLAIVKRGPQMLAAQQAKHWEERVRFDELSGKTLTILGTGGIGREIAKRAAAFDMQIWGINRSGRSVAHFDRIWSGESWRDALPETDFLVIAAPLTAETQHIISARELSLLPRYAQVINIARGALIDEPALIAALQNGTIAGAALDTFETEPLPATSPLWTLPNVILSPHHSGSSPHMRTRVADFFIANLKRYLNGEALENVVNLSAGY